MTGIVRNLTASAALLCGLAVFAFSGRALGSGDVVTGEFAPLKTYASQKGVLKVTLDAAPKTVEIGGVSVKALTFNGTYGAPLLRLKPGDQLKIHLLNHTGELLNLHFHGFHASPLGRGDNIHAVVKQGQAFDYTLNIPKTQPSGLFWYHTHIHGIAEEQINRGLSGAIVVEGLENQAPEIAGAKERLLVLKSYSDPTSADPAMKPLHGVVQSINGAAHTTLVAQTGRTEFWRISNQSANDYFHLSMKGAHFHVVAMDGYRLNADVDQDSLDIAPAGRVEALVRFDKAGDYSLRSGSTPTGSGKSLKPYRELASVTVVGQDQASSPPVIGQSRAPLAPDLSAAAVDTRRTVVFSQKPGEEVYFIDGRVYDHDRMDVRVPLGSVQEWTIRNDTDDMHVFHIHQVHFQVMSINGEPAAANGRIDTVRVPERGFVVVRIAFTDPRILGKFLFHCHVLKHEDKGMMANIEVYDPRRKTPPPNQDLFGFPICTTPPAQGLKLRASL